MDDQVGEEGAPRDGGVGARLRAAREAAGLDLAAVAQRTRVPLRHLAAIESGDYSGLPSPTYAVGFARAYARAVGADEVEAAAGVRAGLAYVPRSPDYEPYEIPDPARVPSRGLAILAAGAALALLILAALWFGTDLLRGREAVAPEPAATVAVVPAPTPLPRATAAAPTGGQVRLTATGRVWLRVDDADGKRLFENTLDPGGVYDVPADAKGPVLSVGRPDKLAVTLDGRAVPPLGDGSHAIKDVKIDGASIAARLAAAPAAAAGPTAAATPAVDRLAAAPRERPRPRPSPTMSDARRANLEAMAAPAATGNTTP